MVLVMGEIQIAEPPTVMQATIMYHILIITALQVYYYSTSALGSSPHSRSSLAHHFIHHSFGVEVLVHPFCLVIHPLSTSHTPPPMRLALACSANQIFVFSGKNIYMHLIGQLKSRSQIGLCSQQNLCYQHSVI